MKENFMLKNSSLSILVLVYVVVLNANIWGNEENTVSPPKVENIHGYIKKTFVPEQGLSDLEKQYVNTISKMTETFAITKDVEVIATRLNSDCAKIWGDLINTSVDINFHTNRGKGISKGVSLIIIKGPLKIEGIPRKTGFIPPNQSNNQEFWIYISGNTVLNINIYPINKTRSMECFFYSNGKLKSLTYRDDKYAQCDVEKTWSENGTFLKEEIIKEPRPFVIQK